MKVLWLSEAETRLYEIEAYIAQDSVEEAIRMVDRIVERAEALARFPLMGRVVPELKRQDIRELVEGNYRIVYLVRCRQVFCVRPRFEVSRPTSAAPV